jgi:hypothetical protein
MAEFPECEYDEEYERFITLPDGGRKTIAEAYFDVIEDQQVFLEEPAVVKAQLGTDHRLGTISANH